MAESRQELVNWVNDLLLLDITKVEQCGTGAVYCQILDSIFLDVPMSKVRYDVNTEYQYLNNFKVLQNTFLKHKIDRSVPVERLVKCRFQDNLEFLQWVRKFWDGNYPGHEYDPLARRKAGPLPTSAVNRVVPGTNATSAGGGSRTSSAAGARTASNPTSIRAGSSTVSSRNVSGSSTASARRPASVQRNTTPGLAGQDAAVRSIRPLKEKISELEAEHEQLVNTVDILETERNFYYDKLFNIELLIQQAVDDLDKTKTETNGTTTETDEDGQPIDSTTETSEKSSVEDTYATLVREIQAILYKTTEGFEIPTQEYETEETF
ncbi:microtubule-binding protein BIM1 [Sugiyamaella lignohabitans]|uniref:Microtubule-binding protein BIM1 n=1 Tax=Sugiyamaella lignohabitans TaxID=796027 RepID=A0A167CIU7_9ASCO|nr:microtubule-binding protein BIM1 [Sugiyamaella lignohabitans]ANB11755.1 microtubule-binding protein BIM1 [Sugiyamaella lignohabitans]